VEKPDVSPAESCHCYMLYGWMYIYLFQ